MSGRSSCPECGTNLRIRDRSYVGRRVSCPECKTGLLILEGNEQGEYVIRRLTPDELGSPDHPGRGKTKVIQDKIFVPAASTQTFFQRVMSSPLTAAWLLAIAVSVLVAVLALAPRHRFTASRALPSPAETEEVPDTTPNDAELQPEHEPPSVADPTQPVPETPPASNPPPVPGAPAIVVSALEPANLDAPLSFGPIAVPSHVVPEDENPSLPPPPPKVDVEGKLTQKLLLYKQSKPVSRRDLIEALEEHLGAPIFYEDDDLGTDNLSKTMTFELENTTVGGVIKTVADSAGWKMEIETTGLRLRRK